ncbi:MAG: hypothetical protein KC478_01895 [Bacteriovoracaceae bacterium]|nr:hypothetical protein [Bacteriovoracaceae bacterium]
MKIKILNILFLLLLAGCKETVLEEELLEGFLDPFTGTKLIIRDSSSLSKTHTNSQSVLIEIDNDDKAIKWCLSETQINLPTSVCNGGAGSDNGWHTSRPTSFSLSSGGGNKEVTLWLMKDDLSIRKESITATIELDTVAPIVTINPASDIISSNVSNYNLSGTCSDSTNVRIDIDGVSYSSICSSNLWAFNADMSSASEGALNINVTQTDLAGNLSTAATDSISKDTVAPSFTLDSFSNYITSSNQSTFTISGTCNEDGNVSVSGDHTDTIACSGGVFSKNIDFTGHGQGAVNLSFDMTDTSGNGATQLNRSLIKDTIAPTVSITSPSGGSFINQANESSITISGNCSEDGQSVSLSGDISASTSCSSGVFSHTFDASSLGEGAVSILADLQDPASNAATQASLSLTKDTVAPALAQTSFVSGSYVSADTVVLGGACESGVNISVSGEETTSIACAGSWSLNTATQSSDGMYLYTFSQVDAAGNTSTINASWGRDRTAPVVTSIDVNGGQTSTGNNNTLISFNTTDTRVDIESFCILYNTTTAPSAGDSCWKTLSEIGESASDNFTLNNYPFAIGTIQGSYEIRIWIKDDVGNISVVGNSGNGTQGTDLYAIAYQPDPPPVFEEVIAVSSDSHSTPLQSVDTTVTIGNDLFIKWKVSDNNPIPAGNVSLYYTTDNSNYTQIATGLNDANNGGCTLGAFSGCYHWVAASPTSAFYKVKVVVQDSGVSSVFALSNSINTGAVNFLSGNTSLGIGGSASSAILIGEGEDNFSDAADPQALAVTKNGYVFYKYKNRGIVYISPEDGLLKVLLEDTNSSTGDGGSVFSATATNVRRIALDYDENLLVYDDDFIRKIDFSTDPWSIDTIAGGGANSPENEAPLLANLPNIGGSITPMPNGDIYFPNSKSLWFLDASENKLKKKVTISGFGIGNNSGDNASYDHTACTTEDLAISYDKATSQVTKLISIAYKKTDPNCGNMSSGGYRGHNANFNITTGVAEAPHPNTTDWSSKRFPGLDGKIYNLRHGRNRLQVFNPSTNAWNNILGNGVNGRCSDGTAALSCPAYIMSAFVNEFGKVYFVDMGVIRYIDDSGNVQSIAGQPRNFGPGYAPLVARYSQINFFDLVGDDVYVKNKLENQIVKFSLTGGNTTLVAGNGIKGGPSDGSDATTSPLGNCGWAMPCSFKVDSTNNRLYHHVGSNIWYIDLTTGNWVNTTHAMPNSGARNSYLGYNGSKLLTYVPTHYGGNGNEVTVSEIDPIGPIENIVLGNLTDRYALNSYFCSGQVGTDCTLAHAQGDYVQMGYKWDSVNSNWLVGYKGRNEVHTIPEGGGVVNLLETTVNNFHSFVYRRDGGNEYIYYCAGSGKIFKRDVLADTETELTLPVPTMQCDGNNMEYHAGRDSLIFIYSENGLYGIAEYKNP